MGVDTGVMDFVGGSRLGGRRGLELCRFGGRAVYVFDLRQSAAGACLVGKRPIWQAGTFAVDGVRVGREGFVVGAAGTFVKDRGGGIEAMLSTYSLEAMLHDLVFAGTGIDVLTEWGELVLRIEVSETIDNFHSAGEGPGELWLFGPGGIFRVSGLEGLSGMGDE